MRKAFLWIIRTEPTNISMEKYPYLRNFSLAIFIGNSSLRLSEVLVNFLSYCYQLSIAKKNDRSDKNLFWSSKNSGHFPIGILGQLWYLIVWIPDLCTLTYIDYEIVSFPFLDGDVTHSTSYGVYICQFIRSTRAASHVADFNTREKF